jgi:hypothetical protein
VGDARVGDEQLDPARPRRELGDRALYLLALGDVGGESCIARATFAPVMGRPASCSQKSVCRYSSSATVTSAMPPSY